MKKVGRIIVKVVKVTLFLATSVAVVIGANKLLEAVFFKEYRTPLKDEE